MTKENVERTFFIVDDDNVFQDQNGSLTPVDDIHDIVDAQAEVLDFSEAEVYPLEVNLPYTRRRHKKPYALRVLDCAITNSNHTTSKSKRREISGAVETILKLDENKRTSAVTKRLKILSRRYPDIVPTDLVCAQLETASPSLNKISVNALSGVSYHYPYNLDNPLFMKLFKDDARALLEIASFLTGRQLALNNCQIFFGDRGQKLTPYGDWRGYFSQAYSYRNLLSRYQERNIPKFNYFREPSKMSGWETTMILHKLLMIPIGLVEDQPSGQTLLELNLTPNPEIESWTYDSFMNGKYFDFERFYRNGRLIISWGGKPQSDGKIAGKINEIITR